MSTGTSSIRILYQGRTYTCRIPTETFHATTISALQLLLLRQTGVDIGYPDLFYSFGSQRLVAEYNGRKLTFGDYGIRNGDSITVKMDYSSQFDHRFIGGECPGFMPLRFADVYSEDSFKEIKLSNSAPDWRIIAPGINFEGTCKNRFCQAENNVYIRRGFYDSTGGTCMLNYEITQLECPICKQRLDKKDINGVGVYKAKLEVKSKPSEGREVVVNIEARDKFMYAGCMDDNDKVDYEYILLIVRRF